MLHLPVSCARNLGDKLLKTPFVKLVAEASNSGLLPNSAPLLSSASSLMLEILSDPEEDETGGRHGVLFPASPSL